MIDALNRCRHCVLPWKHLVVILNLSKLQNGMQERSCVYYYNVMFTKKKLAMQHFNTSLNRKCRTSNSQRLIAFIYNLYSLCKDTLTKSIKMLLSFALFEATQSEIVSMRYTSSNWNISSSLFCHHLNQRGREEDCQPLRSKIPYSLHFLFFFLLIRFTCCFSW